MKLPQPLPYEFVDEMIDQNLRFGTSTDEDEDGTILTQIYARRADGRETGNFSRLMFSLIEDHYGESSDDYVTWHGSGSSWVWTAQELTEDEIDEILGLTDE